MAPGGLTAGDVVVSGAKELPLEKLAEMEEELADIQIYLKALEAPATIFRRNL